MSGSKQCRSFQANPNVRIAESQLNFFFFVSAVPNPMNVEEWMMNVLGEC